MEYHIISGERVKFYEIGELVSYMEFGSHLLPKEDCQGDPIEVVSVVEFDSDNATEVVCRALAAAGSKQDQLVVEAHDKCGGQCSGQDTKFAKIIGQNRDQEWVAMWSWQNNRVGIMKFNSQPAEGK
jgi:hypothetical protein